MSSQKDNKIIMGRFARPYGVRGWIKVISFTDPKENLLKYTSWLVKHKNQWQPLEIEDGKGHNQYLIVKLPTYNTPEAVQAWTNDLIAVERDALPTLPKEEYYWADLIGLRVITQNGVDIGQIESFLATNSNDVMVIRNNHQQERLIPYLTSIVKS